ncbi:hypothetical protein C3L33_19994, partial [Rhododendron williamsianum]
MAEATILGIIAKISGEIAVSRIIKESSRLSRVREDLIWIETEMRRIQSYLEDAEAKQFKTKGVSNFIREIQDLAYDVEDIIDTYFPKISLNRTRWKRLLDFRNMRIAHGFVKEVEGIRRRVEDIKNSRQTFGIDECSRSCEEDTWNPRQSFPHLDEPNVVGFDDLIKILTTLARKVYNSARQSKVYDSHRQRFDCAAWICVSESPNEKGLLRDIAGQVGLEKEKIERNVETNLYEFLRGKGPRRIAPSFCWVNLDVFHPVEFLLSNLQTFYGLPGHLFKADWLRKLSSLRTLRVDSVNKDIIGVLSDAAPLSHKLEELSLVGNALHLPETTSLNFSRYENLSELLIEGVRLSKLPHDKLPPNLTKLILIRTHLTTDPTEALKKLQKLKFLILGSRSYSGKELVCSGEPGNFPQLEVLEIVYLPNLERVVVEEGGMPRLRDFYIVDCNPETRIPDGVRNVMRTVKTNNMYWYD